MTSIKKLAYRGALWTTLGYGTSQVLRFVNNIILAWLLGPEYFGLMAVVNILLTGLELFSDIGIGQNIVRSKRGDELNFLNTAWTVQAMRGFLLWFFCLAITIPAARYYEDERLLYLLPFVGLSSIFTGFSSTSIHTLNRQMSLEKLTVFELVTQVFSIAVMLSVAYYNRNSVWSLAIGGVSLHVSRMLISHKLIPGFRNRFAWDKSAFEEIISFGKWVFFATALMFLAEQADRLILGKLLSFTTLGVYSIAYTLASMPREIIKRLSYKVIFPAISNHIDLPRSTLRSKILHQRRKILIAFALPLAGLVTVGDLIIGFLYKEDYIQATWMMPILCTGIWFSVLFYTTSPALLAIGKPLYSSQSNLARFLVISIGLPLAFRNYGILGAIVAIAVSDMPLYLVNLYGLWREKLSCFIQDIQGTVCFIVSLITLLLIRYYSGLGLPIQNLLESSLKNS
ncbi:MAG: oligosaccharide flippase family protein [Mastigocoleus sp.]